MIKIPEDHIQQYLKIFGTGLNQIDILQEECAELIKALGKYKRSVGHFTNVDPIDNIVEEMTHVAISSEIVARILNINPEDIQREVNKIAEFVKGTSLTLYNNFDITKLFIETPEGGIYVKVGDYIIQGVHGEYYSCKPNIFTETYEEIENG